MDAVTYPQEAVISFIEANFIPVQIESSHQVLMDQFKVKWTPTLLVLDAEGGEHYRTVGFLAPEDFIPTFTVAKGRWHLDSEQYAEAISLFDQVIESYPNSDAAAEAVFFRGVSRYKKENDPQPLKEVYNVLTNKYSQSSWTKKAAPYRLIP
ncbi:MAG: hypothetical protein PHW74_01255 [Desulfobacca sp.]|nr:hypothetical protein [Desulfobacca sp.]